MLRFLRREGVLILAAIQFLTRLPMPDTGWEADRLGRAAKHFPTAGFVIGAIVGGVFLAAASALPVAAVAGVALAFGMLLTGALHEDGLADTFDGLGGGMTRDRALEIMRDSRIGTYGGAALLSSILIRWAAITALAEAAGPQAAALALLAAHGMARVSSPVMLAGFDYAREGPTARDVAGGVGVGEAAFAFGLGLAAACALLGVEAGLFAALFCGVAGAVVAFWALGRLGGYTGDVLGAMEQAGEAAVLLALAALWA